MTKTVLKLVLKISHSVSRRLSGMPMHWRSPVPLLIRCSPQDGKQAQCIRCQLHRQAIGRTVLFMALDPLQPCHLDSVTSQCSRLEIMWQLISMKKGRFSMNEIWKGFVQSYDDIKLYFFYARPYFQVFVLAMQHRSGQVASGKAESFASWLRGMWGFWQLRALKRLWLKSTDAQVELYQQTPWWTHPIQLKPVPRTEAIPQGIFCQYNCLH